MDHQPAKQARIDYQHLEEVRQVVDHLIKTNAALSAEFMRRYQISDNIVDLDASNEFCKLIDVLRETQGVVDLDSELQALLASRLPTNTSIWTRFLRFAFSLVGMSRSPDVSHSINSIQHQTRM